MSSVSLNPGTKGFYSDFMNFTFYDSGPEGPGGSCQTRYFDIGLDRACRHQLSVSSSAIPLGCQKSESNHAIEDCWWYNDALPAITDSWLYLSRFEIFKKARFCHDERAYWNVIGLIKKLSKYNSQSWHRNRQRKRRLRHARVREDVWMW